MICLQQHQITHKDDFKKGLLYENFLLTCSATKTSVSAAIGGVGFLLSRRANNSIIYMEKNNERIAIYSRWKALLEQLNDKLLQHHQRLP